MIYISFSGKQYLNEYIKHYEGINYNTATLHDSHIRAKRSVDSHVNLQFFAHGRYVVMTPSRDLFPGTNGDQACIMADTYVNMSNNASYIVLKLWPLFFIPYKNNGLLHSCKTDQLVQR